MAPLRSSRHTRAAEHNAPARNRAGVLDFDPTDGLPIRKYVLESIRINQDTAIDPNDTTQAAVVKTDDFPWPDQPLPSYYDQLPPHSQELLRRSRQGDRDVRTSVWDKKSEEWVRAEKARARGVGPDVLKSRHLMNVDAPEAEDDAEDEDEEDEDEEDANGNGLVPPVVHKKRKTATTGLTERILEVKKWTQLSFDRADKMSEPKFLAERKPGMPNFYAPQYLKNAIGYGTQLEGTAYTSAGFDLGDGSGLGSALGGGSAAGGAETPVKRNMPPKRKKKKLGGPGRKKKEVLLAEEAARRAAEEGVTGEDKPDGEGTEKKEDGEGDGGDEEGSGEESEGEGSEEGEVADEPSAVEAVQVETTVVPPVEPPTIEVKEPEVVEVKMTDVEEIPLPAPEQVEPLVPAPIEEPLPTEEIVVTAEVIAEPTPEAKAEPKPDPAPEVMPEIEPEPQPDPQPQLEKKEDPPSDLLAGLEAAVEGMEKFE